MTADAATRARSELRQYHAAAYERSAAELDALLGLPAGDWESNASQHPRIQRLHPGESIVNVATPYPICRGLFQALDLGPNDHFLDLGCADGRVVLYGALVSPAYCSGIELVVERATNGKRAINNLGLQRATLIAGNVLDEDWSAANVFYAHRPFSVETEALVLERLHSEGRKRPIRMATHRLQPSLFDRAVFAAESHGALQILRSHAAA